jgi:acetylornithine/succinyldiaminopimelate/putrescine aminotransferase
MVAQMARKYLIPTYSTTGKRLREGLVLHAGEGATVCDSEDKPYIDFGAGIAVNALGFADEGWTKAMHEALDLVVHTSNLYHTAPPLKLAKMLVDHSCFDKVFFCNSGTEANEAALKFAKRWAAAQPQPSGFDSAGVMTKPACAVSDRTDLEVDCKATQGVCECWPQGAARPGDSKTRFVAFQGGFHGRTMGALSVTHKPAIRQPFAPLVGDVSFAKYNDIESEPSQ